MTQQNPGTADSQPLHEIENADGTPLSTRNNERYTEPQFARRALMRTAIAAGGLSTVLATSAAGQPEDEEEEELPLNAKHIPTINLSSEGLIPVTVSFDPGIGTTPGLIESLVLGPLRAEPEHAAHVERFSRIKSNQENTYKVLFDPKTAETWFQPDDTQAFVQTTTDPILRDEDPVKVVAGRRIPDLVPIGFSRSDTGMIVTVENRGTQEAGASTTEVDFGDHGADQQPTPAVDSGGTTQLTFTIPAGCHDPDCEFTITVDVIDEVGESNEENNTLDGAFIG